MAKLAVVSRDGGKRRVTRNVRERGLMTCRLAPRRTVGTMAEYERHGGEDTTIERAGRVRFAWHANATH
jgi:hypothetical protein